MASIFKGQLPRIRPRTILDDDSKHYAALGRFVAMYAAAEAGAHVALRKISGFDDDIARFLWGNKRLADVTGAIRKLLPKSNISNVQKEMLLEALTQLHHLSDARGRLVHRIFEVVDDDTISTSNQAHEKALENAQTETFTLTELTCMEHDAFLISRQFTLISEPSKIAGDVEKLYEVLMTPWSYKPKLLDSARQRRRASAQSRKPRLRPDQKKPQNHAKD